MGSTRKGKTITPSEISTEFSHHDPTVARINNGSFGSCPATVIAAQQRHQLHFLSQPDHHYFHSLKPSLLLSRLSLKSLINASSVSQISLLDNATTAAALVLHHISRLFLTSSFPPGDSAVILHYAYGAVKKSVEAYVAKSGGRVIEAKLPFPIYSNDEIISSFRTALNEAKYLHNSKVRLAVIDHITSMPTVVIPVKKLVQMCRDEGVDYVFVDAAHAIGNVDIDVEDIGADFYTSNLHKWFFCPPSVAFLYSRNPDADLHHPVVSHEYGNGLANESGWIGTRDYSAQLVVPEAVEFVERFEGGIEGIRTRNHERVVEMGEMLVKAWGTNLGSPPEMCSSMVMVGLPVALGIRSDSDCFKLRTHLRECDKIEVPIYFRMPEDGEVDPVTGYARISHQVYNKEEDYLRFRDAVNKLVSDGFTCARLL